MKTNTLPCLLFALTASFAAAGDIRLADCPPKVRATIEANARDGKIEEVDLIAIDDKRIYVAEVELKHNVDLKIYVDANGGLMKTREDVLPADKPAFIDRIVAETGGRLDDLEKEIAGGTVTYHLDVDRQQAPDLDIVVSADGKVIRQTEEADD